MPVPGFVYVGEGHLPPLFVSVQTAVVFNCNFFAFESICAPF